MLFLLLLSLSLALTVYAQDGNCDYGPNTCINGRLLLILIPFSLAEINMLILSPIKVMFGEKPIQAM